MFSDNVYENYMHIVTYYPEYESVLTDDRDATAKAIIIHIFDKLSREAECNTTLTEFVIQCLYITYIYTSIVSVKYSFNIGSHYKYSINGFKIDVNYAIMFGLIKILEMFDIDMSSDEAQVAIKYQIEYLNNFIGRAKVLPSNPQTLPDFEEYIAITLLNQLQALLQTP